MGGWYCNLLGEISGPFELEELVFLRNRAKLSPNDLVRNGPNGTWTQARNVEQLFPSGKAAVKMSATSRIPREPAANAEAQFLKPDELAVQPVAVKNRTVTVVEPRYSPSTILSEAVHPHTPPPLSNRDESERHKHVLIGTGIGTGIVLLILLLLLLLMSFGGLSGAGGGSGGGSGSGHGKGNGSGTGDGTGDGSAGGSGRGASGDASRPIASAKSKADDQTDARPHVPVSEQTFPEERLETDPEANALVALKQDDTAPPKVSGGQSGRMGGGAGGGGGGGSEGNAFFGVKSKGRKFVYIVDCSGSMFGQPFQKACYELSESITRLKPNQSMYVFFFDDIAYPMLGNERQLMKATPANVKKVQEWINQVHGGGGTNPREAILDALELRPDVIYLLTDGAFDPGVVDEVRQRNKYKVVINTIGFMNRGGEPLLQKIAKENRGDYRFVP